MRYLIAIVLLIFSSSALAQKQRLLPLPWEERQRIKSLSAGEIFEIGLAKLEQHDPKLAARYYQAAIDKGSVDARAHLGSLYVLGEGVYAERALGLEMMREAAESGKPHLMYLLAATITESLQEFSKEWANEAVYWLERASTLGFVPATALLAEAGIRYPGLPRTRVGYSIPKAALCNHAGLFSMDVAPMVGDADNLRAEARESLRNASEQGDPEAMAALGRLYMLGIGVEKNLAEATKWHERAAELGDAAARQRLALLYYESPKTQTDAYQLFKSLAANGDQLAMEHLFKMYTNGSGVQQDYHQAAYWKLREKELGCSVTANLLPQHIVATKKIMKQEGYFEGVIDAVRTAEFEKAYAGYFARKVKD